MVSTTAPRHGGTDHTDVRLLPLIEAATEADASVAIEQLLGGEVRDVMREVVRRELTHSPAGAAYIEDVVADVRLRLMRKLSQLRRETEPPDAGATPVENFLAYASVVAENACYAFLRMQYPERTRFRNRVRYAVSHHPRTALMRDDSGLWRCQTTHAVRTAPEAGATQRLLDNPVQWLASARIDTTAPLPALIDHVLARLDRPVELDRLVDALAVALGIVDSQHPGVRDDGGPVKETADPSPGISAVLEQRQELGQVWAEIVQLPLRQRTALLLNLRDPEGGAVLHLLPGTGVISMDGIAAGLEIDGSALAQLWDRLPLEDLAIAAELGLTRQQVINLRKAARARLARRLRGSA